MKSNRVGGFSLIELMIVVFIVGILAAIAMPSYNNYIIRGSRAAAQAEMLDLASRQEKIYLNSNAYAFSVTANYNGTSAGGLGETTGLTDDGKYTLSLTDSAGVALAAPSQTFTLIATPVATKSQVNDGTISISENGQKLWNGTAW